MVTLRFFARPAGLSEPSRLVVLGEALRPREIAAIVLVSVASAGAAWADRRAPLD